MSKKRIILVVIGIIVTVALIVIFVQNRNERIKHDFEVKRQQEITDSIERQIKIHEYKRRYN